MMSNIIKIATKQYIINSNGLYACPECNSVLGKIHNFYSVTDNDYTLQCPVNREHCTRKTNVSEPIASSYDYIPNVKRCTVCDAVLSHVDYKYLVCPNDSSHMSRIRTNVSEIEKIGYEPDNQLMY